MNVSPCILNDNFHFFDLCYSSVHTELFSMLSFFSIQYLDYRRLLKVKAPSIRVQISRRFWTLKVCSIDRVDGFDLPAPDLIASSLTLRDFFSRLLSFNSQECGPGQAA